MLSPILIKLCQIFIKSLLVKFHVFFFSQLLLFFEILLLLNFDTKTFLTCVVNGEQPLKIYRYIKTFFEYLKISFLKCHIIMVNRIIWRILLIRIHHSLLVKYFWESNVLKFELHKKSHFFSTILSRPPSDFPHLYHYFSLFLCLLIGPEFCTPVLFPCICRYFASQQISFWFQLNKKKMSKSLDFHFLLIVISAVTTMCCFDRYSLCWRIQESMVVSSISQCKNYFKATFSAIFGEGVNG